MSEYTIKVPIEYEGDDKFNRIIQSLKKTANETNVSAKGLVEWQRSMNRAIGDGYTFERALGSVNVGMKKLYPSVDAFTDRLRSNIKAMDDATKATKRLQDAADAAEKSRIKNEKSKLDALSRRSIREGDKSELAELLSPTGSRYSIPQDGTRNVFRNRAKRLPGTGSNTSPSSFRDSVELTEDEYSRLSERINRAKVLSSKYGSAFGSSQQSRIANNFVADKFRQIDEEEKEAVKEAKRIQQFGGRIQRVAGLEGGRIAGALTGAPGGGFIGMQVAREVGLSGAAAVGVGAAAVGALGLYEIIKSTNATAEYAVKQKALSQELGTTVQFTQLLGRVSDVTGVSTESLHSVFKKLNEEIRNGGEESAKTQKALGALGLDAGIAFEKPQQQIGDLLGALKKVGDETERERLVVALFGDAGRSLLPLVDSWNSVSDAVVRSGVVMDNSAIKKLQEYDEAIKLFGLTWDKVKQELALGVGVPLVTFFVGGGNKQSTYSKGVDTFFDTLNAVPDAIINAARRAALLFKYVKTDDGVEHGVDTLSKKDISSSFGKLSKNSEERDLSRSSAEVAKLKLGNLENDRLDTMGKKDKLREEISQLEIQKGVARSAYLSPSGGKKERSRVVEIETEIAAKKKELNPGPKGQKSERQKQIEALDKLVEKPVDGKQSLALANELPSRFNLITDTDAYAAYLSFLQGNSLGYIKLRANEQLNNLSDKVKSGTSRYDKSLIVGLALTTGPKPRSMTSYNGETGDTDESVATPRNSDFGVLSSANQAVREEQELDYRHRDRKVKKGLTAELTTIKGEEEDESSTFNRKKSIREYGIRSQRSNLTEAQFNEAEFRSNTIFDPSKVNATGKESSAYIGALAKNPIGDDAAGYIASADAKEAEIRKLLNDRQTEQIDHIIRFNETIDRASENIRKQWGEGISGIILGAQSGGGRGAASAAKSFLTGQESTIIKNVVDEGIKKVSGTTGNPLGIPVNSPLAKIFENTVFGSVGTKKDIPLTDNTTAIKELTAVIQTKLLTGAGSDVVGKLPLGSVVNAASTAGAGVGAGDTDGGLPSSTTNLTYGGLSSNISKSISIARAATPVAGIIASGGTASQTVGSALGAFSKVGDVLDGVKYLGKIGGVINGTVGLSGAQKVGLAGAAIGAAAGAYGGIKMASKGGAKNILGGLAETAGSIAAFTGPAAPFVAAGAAALGIVASLLPDLKKKRQDEISRRIFTDQYQAPDAVNVSAAGGRFSDTDSTGRLRTSNLSAFPIVSNPYLDVPRRTVVPGHEIQPFGGYENVTGAKVPVIINITAMDGQDVHRVLMKNGGSVVDSFHKSISGDYHPVINTLSQQLGTR
jgi:hypothetical protein